MPNRHQLFRLNCSLNFEPIRPLDLLPARGTLLIIKNGTLPNPIELPLLVEQLKGRAVSTILAINFSDDEASTSRLQKNIQDMFDLPIQMIHVPHVLPLGEDDKKNYSERSKFLIKVEGQLAYPTVLSAELNSDHAYTSHGLPRELTSIVVDYLGADFVKEEQKEAAQESHLPTIITRWFR
jgi:hypothetical protein